MSNLKLTALAVLALGSSSVFAGTMGPVCTPGNVTVPCERTAWDVGVQALYLETVYSGAFGYHDARRTDGLLGIITSPSWDLGHDHDNWDWGFKLEASYHFSTGNDLNLNWYHYRDKNDYLAVNTLPILSTLGILTSLVDFGIAGRVESDWDAVNLEFGQHVDFGEFKDIRFHAGIQYAKIERNDFSEAAALGILGGTIVTAPLVNLVSNNDFDFDGVGPRAGMDMTYNWGNGFAIYGNTAAAILVGTTNFNQVHAVVAPLATVLDLTLLGSAYHGSKTAIVPELELKLGAKYNYAMAQGDLTLDVGYMAVNYFNVFDGFTQTDTNTLHETNFAVHGPYIGLKWVGAV